MKDRLHQIEDRLKMARKGQWKSIRRGQSQEYDVITTGCEEVCFYSRRRDAAFIANAKRDIKWLITMVNRLRFTIFAIDAQRQNFMDVVYQELADDPDNLRANRIIDAFDRATGGGD